MSGGLPELDRVSSSFVGGNNEASLRKSRLNCSTSVLREGYKMHVTARPDAFHENFVLYTAQLLEVGDLQLPAAVMGKCKLSKETLMHVARSVVASLELRSFDKGQQLCRLDFPANMLHVFFLSGDVTVSTHDAVKDDNRNEKKEPSATYDAFGMRVTQEQATVQEVWHARQPNGRLSASLFFHCTHSPFAVVALTHKVETLCIPRRALEAIESQVVGNAAVYREILAGFELLKGTNEASRNKLAVMATRRYVGQKVDLVKSKTEASVIHFLVKGECVLLADIQHQQVSILKTATSQQKSALHDIAEELSPPASSPLVVIRGGETCGMDGVFRVASRGGVPKYSYSVRTQTRCEVVSMAREHFVSVLSGLSLNLIKNRLLIRHRYRRARVKKIQRQAEADRERLVKNLDDPDVPDWLELTADKVALVPAGKPLGGKAGLVHKVLRTASSSSASSSSSAQHKPDKQEEKKFVALWQRYEQISSQLGQQRLVEDMCVAPLANQKIRIPRRLQKFQLVSQKPFVPPTDARRADTGFAGLRRRAEEHARRNVLVSVKKYALGLEPVDLYPSAVRKRENALFSIPAVTTEEHASLKQRSAVAKRLAKQNRYRGRDVLKQSKQGKLCYVSSRVAIKRAVSSDQVSAYLQQIRNTERGDFSRFGANYPDVYGAMVLSAMKPRQPLSARNASIGESSASRGRRAALTAR